jgi:phosphatidylglycerophosphate synthase
MIKTWANLVTTVRAVGTAAVVIWTVIIFFTQPAPRWQLLAVIVAAVCECLDGVDGRVARALGESSTFGAWYDMEVDSVLLLALSFALVGTGAAGWWVLILGGWHYAFLISRVVFPVLRTPLPYRWSRRLIAVLVIGSAIGGLAFDLIGLPQPVITGLLLGAAGLLTYSFGRDIVGQLRSSLARSPRPLVDRSER